MKLNSMNRIMLAVVLSISLIATGCSAQWISVALADLPVLTQMALNLAALVATLQSGKQLTPAEALAIQNISAEASKDLTLLESLYNAYKASPSADTLQKIEGMIEQTNQEFERVFGVVLIVLWVAFVIFLVCDAEVRWPKHSRSLRSRAAEEL